MLAVIGICSLGTHLTIAGHRTVPLPWALVRHLPLLRYALPSRLSLYLALGVAVALALWLSRRPGPLGLVRRAAWVVAVVSCALLIPNPWPNPGRLVCPLRPFFTSGAAAREFNAARPSPGGAVRRARRAGQARRGYPFSLAGGHLGEYP